jgi:hypothetical protein
MDRSPVPVSLGVFVERRKHDRQDHFHIVADKVAEILVVPEVQRTFRDLEVGTGNRLCELVEEGLLYLRKLGGVHNLKDVLYFVQEHNLLRAVDFRPITQKTKHDLYPLAEPLNVRWLTIPLLSKQHPSPKTAQYNTPTAGGTC